MERHINAKHEVAAFLKGTDRYIHFIKEVATSGVVWLIGDENGVGTYGDREGSIFIPVFPHEGSAVSGCVGLFSRFFPISVNLQDWAREWLPDLDNAGYLIAVYPTPSSNGVVVDSGRFIDDMNEEIKSLNG